MKRNLKRDYDAVCKRILSEKIILAWLMKTCILEYEDFTAKEISTSFIESAPEIAVENVHSDEKIIINPRIQGMNVDDSSVDDGSISFDVKFKALLPNKEYAEIIINVEAQSGENLPYPLIKRAVYYCSRLISSQKGREFTGSNYQDIKKVYSIWLVTKPSKRRNSSITNYNLKEFSVLGEYTEEKEKYDLLEIIMVRLGKDKTVNKLIELLTILFSDEINLSSKEREEKLSKDFGIDVNGELKKELDEMCNLSQAVEERGIEKGILIGEKLGEKRGISIGEKRGISIGEKRGISIGEKRGKIIGLLMAGLDIDKIMELTSFSKDEIIEIKNSLN